LEKGLIKNYKYPFFYFKDNKNSNLNIDFNEEILKEINFNEEPLLCYKKYLPRNNPLDFIIRNPVNYFLKKKSKIF